MADLITGMRGNATNGEKRFAQRIREKLSDDWLAWYDVPLGTVRKRYPDFVMFHPKDGLLLLEVKDWKIETIQEINSKRAKLKVGERIVTTANPLQQVLECTHALAGMLSKDKALCNQDGPNKGKLKFPYGYGVVLTNITRLQFVQHKLDSVLPASLVICKDEMVPSTDAVEFEKRLRAMYTVKFKVALNAKETNRLRWYLFPEIRVNATNSSAVDEDPFGEEECFDFNPPQIVKVMDLAQERLARSLGDGHRVIHGVAGSGKTLILGYRAIQMAKQYERPVLVLCYNVALAARLRESIAGQEYCHLVEVKNFHAWCSEQLKTNGLEVQDGGSNYFERLVQTVIDAVATGAIPNGQYAAVLIDEGHDLEPEWLKLTTRMVDPETESLLLLYDDAQSIYSVKEKLGFTLKSVGINVSGRRSKILRTNYRNTKQILDFARAACNELFTDKDKETGETPRVVPLASGGEGHEPAVRSLSSEREEAEYIAHCLATFKERGTAWSDIGVLYRSKSMGELINKACERKGIPVQWLLSSADKRNLDISANSVKLMTMHSSKGLEFPLVVVSGVHQMPQYKCDEAAEAKLLYVALTRATQKLMVTYSKEKGFAQRFAA